MSRRTWRAAAPWVAVVYFAAALEVVIMITPFTAYFYSVYAPILQFLEARSATAWLTSFFLPHISDHRDPLLTALAYMGPALLGLGLGIFLVCAYQVYSAKLRRRGVVTGGIYARVRHPQYLGLAIAGLGLLFYWPRFIILVLYVVMLFLYYLLARNEENRMTRRYGESYDQYAKRLPMFLPGDPAGRVLTRITRGRPLGGVGVTTLFALSLLGSLGVAAGLRAYGKSRLTTVHEGNVLAVSLSDSDESALRRRVATALADAQVRERVSQHPEAHTLVAYVLPQEYMMQHLIADLGEHEAHHGGGEDPGLLTVLSHLAEMYALRPLRQLRAGAESPKQRIIFTEAVTPGGEPVPRNRALASGILRYPLFFVDLDDRQVTMTMDTPPRHTWGNIPVPAF